MMDNINPKTLTGSNKVSYYNVSSQVLTEVAVAMHEGGVKHGRFNYRGAPVVDSTMYDATMRHLQAHMQGEDIDGDSGLAHLSKAIASLFVWRDAYISGMIEDNRPPLIPTNIEPMNAVTMRNNVRYDDKNPKHYSKANHEV